MNTQAQGSSPLPNSFEPDKKMVRHRQTHKGDKQKTLMVTFRFGEVFDMALLTVPGNHYQLGNVITFRRSHFGVE